MAFCEKCGKELGPDGKCDCQQSQQTEAPQAETTKQATASQAPKKGNKALIGVVAAVVVVLLIAIIAVAGRGNYKTPVKDLVKLINKQSTDVFAYQDIILNPVYADYYETVLKMLKKNDNIEDLLDGYQESLENFYDDIEGFKITKCDITKAEEMKSKELREISNYIIPSKSRINDELEELGDYDKADYEDLADDLDISKSEAKKLVKETISYLKALSKAEITEGYTVTVRIYAKYDGDQDKTDKIENIRIIKMNGKWYIYDSYNLFNSFRFSDDLSDVSMYSLYNKINPRMIQGWNGLLNY